MKVNKKNIFASLLILNFLDANADGCCKATYAEGLGMKTKQMNTQSEAVCKNLPTTNPLWRGIPRGSIEFTDGKSCEVRYGGSAIGQVLESLRQVQARRP